MQGHVEFIHYVERLYQASTTVTHGHFDDTEPDAGGHTADAPSETR